MHNNLRRLFRPRPVEMLRRGLSVARSWVTGRTALREVLDSLPQGVVLLDSDGRYVHWNPRYADIYSGSADLFRVGARLEDTLRVGVRRGHYPEARGREEEWIARRMHAIRNPAGKSEQRLSDGRWILIDERSTSDGGYIGIRVDVTDLKRRETAYRQLFDDNPVPMLVLSADDGTVLAANGAAVDQFGFPAEDLIGRPFALMADGEADLATDRDADDPAQERRCVTAAGDVVDMQIYARPHLFGDDDAVLLALFDVTERNRAKAEAAYLAHHDYLTGLANRSYLNLRLGEILESAEPGTSVGILLVDLDHFKTINDTLGHHAGDALLKEVARRIRASIAAGDVAARLGGDEFVVVTTFADVDDLRATAERLIGSFEPAIVVDEQDIRPQASIGVAIWPADGATPEELLRNADLALYRAKAEGRGTYRYFETEMDARLRKRRALELELRTALDDGQLAVHYQPLVDLATRTVTSFEALVRWQHPERGAIPPAEFIPLAEEGNLIGRIGEFVLREACRTARTWPGEVRVAVNLSPLQFRSGTLFQTVRRILFETGLPASRLELEITEALLLERTESVLATLHALRALGVRIAMDDFGTGYSSLSYLRSFPFDKIKIDQSFVRDVASDPEAVAIVRAIVTLGGSLGMRVTAEGIEDEAAVGLLDAVGCNEGQGYFFSRPSRGEDVPAMLERVHDGLARSG